MPPLNNSRHEKYAQALFEGQPQNAAYEAAGFRYHEGNASRLRRNEKIVARLAELQEAVAESSQVTVASLLRELEHARKRADSLDQLAASVKAIEAKAKVSGLLTQKIELNANTNNGMTYDDENTSVDVALRMAKEAAVVLSEKELAEFMEVIHDAWASITQFLASCKARPVSEVSASEIERKRLGFARNSDFWR
jgi:hypothetical protein